jgi:hypothetical protein
MSTSADAGRWPKTSPGHNFESGSPRMIGDHWLLCRFSSRGLQGRRMDAVSKCRWVLVRLGREVRTHPTARNLRLRARRRQFQPTAALPRFVPQNSRDCQILISARTELEKRCARWTKSLERVQPEANEVFDDRTTQILANVLHRFRHR